MFFYIFLYINDILNEPSYKVLQTLTHYFGNFFVKSSFTSKNETTHLNYSYNIFDYIYIYIYVFLILRINSVLSCSQLNEQGKTANFVVVQIDLKYKIKLKTTNRNRSKQQLLCV